MSSVLLTCTHCEKSFYRSLQHINENRKLNQKTYCSNKCVGLSHRRILPSLTCENKLCNKTFPRRPYEISIHNYCSSSCAAKVNGRKNARHRASKKICAYCQKEFINREKYCSTFCQYKGYVISKDVIIDQIRTFYNLHGRIPLKKEFSHPRAARERFGSWNKTIVAAGFTPNPVMFANEYIAKDGHRCDSLSEKIIDDWLTRKELAHTRNVHYPGNTKLTVDFVIADY